MAKRGSQGGLLYNTSNVIRLLSAFDRDIILVETVGVGQTELDIMQSTDTTVVILSSGAGDTIQTMKAGLLEIADIFVVNKADRPGADNLIVELRAMLERRPAHAYWQVPVLAAEAVNNVGTQELYEQIVRHRKTMEETGLLVKHRKEWRRDEFMEEIEHRLGSALLRLVQRDEELGDYMAKVEAAEIAPISAAKEVVHSGKLSASSVRRVKKGRTKEQAREMT